MYDMDIILYANSTRFCNWYTLKSMFNLFLLLKGFTPGPTYSTCAMHGWWDYTGSSVCMRGVGAIESTDHKLARSLAVLLAPNTYWFTWPVNNTTYQLKSTIISIVIICGTLLTYKHPIAIYIYISMLPDHLSASHTCQCRASKYTVFVHYKYHDMDNTIWILDDLVHIHYYMELTVYWKIIWVILKSKQPGWRHALSVPIKCFQMQGS